MVTGEYFEPNSTSPTRGPIFLAKEDNATSEQTFKVAIQISNSVPHQGIQPATLNVDYNLSSVDPLATSVVLQFLSSQQRLYFPFTLFADLLAEGPEAFQASSSPENTAVLNNGTMVSVPRYQNPESLFAQTFVNIEDDEREFQ